MRFPTLFLEAAIFLPNYFFMKLNTKLIFSLLIALTLFSCNDNKESANLLKLAQESFETNPNQVLILLDSIQNPENMDKDSYMRYIVTYIRARSETSKDIISDTLIFEAQKYFDEKGNLEESALADYYAGKVYYAKGLLPKALESYMHGAYDAQESGNDLLAMKSHNNIGNIYYERDVLDSAIINYQKALALFDKIENSDKNKSLPPLVIITTNTNIARAYEESSKLDSAYIYYNKVLDKAIETDNKKYESFSLQNLGIVCYNIGEYDKAVEYLQSTLAMDVTDNIQTRQIYLYLLNIYNKKQDSKLAKQYADSVIANLPEVTYIYTIKGMYAALADYYQQLGDYKEALKYRNLEKATQEKVEKEANTPALLAADKNFYLAKKDKEVKQFRSHICFFLIIGVVVIGVVFIFILFVWKDHKKDKAEIQACADKYDEIKALLYSMSDKYPKIEAEIKSMLEDE